MFQVVDAGGNPVTQRQHPGLTTVHPTPVDGGLTLDADGRDSVTVATPTAPTSTVDSLLGVPVDAADVGEAAADWFSDLLGVPVRLVPMTDDGGYRLPIATVDMSLNWADAASVLVTNSASLDWLSQRADE